MDVVWSPRQNWSHVIESEMALDNSKMKSLYKAWLWVLYRPCPAYVRPNLDECQVQEGVYLSWVGSLHPEPTLLPSLLTIVKYKTRIEVFGKKKEVPKRQQPYPMVLDGIPNTLLQSQEQHGTCPLQQHQACAHPTHYNDKKKKWKWEKESRLELWY